MLQCFRPNLQQGSQPWKCASELPTQISKIAERQIPPNIYLLNQKLLGVSVAIWLKAEGSFSWAATQENYSSSNRSDSRASSYLKILSLLRLLTKIRGKAPEPGLNTLETGASWLPAFPLTSSVTQSKYLATPPVSKLYIGDNENIHLHVVVLRKRIANTY